MSQTHCGLCHQAIDTSDEILIPLDRLSATARCATFAACYACDRYELRDVCTYLRCLLIFAVLFLSIIMAPTKHTCAGCKVEFTGSKFMKCRKCSAFYDLDCANVSEQRFRNTLSKEQKSTWLCVECMSKQPKTGNLNTPIREHTHTHESKTCAGVSDNEDITFRKADPRLPSGSSSTEVSATGEWDNFTSTVTERVLKAIKSELPTMFSSILQQELSSIMTELRDFRASLKFYNEEYEEMKATTENLKLDCIKLDRENNLLKATVGELSYRLNNMEQNLRENNLEVHGIPEHRSENLPNMLQQCAKVVGHNLVESEVIKCTRVARQNKDSKIPRTVVVKFNNIKSRDTFYSAVYRYNKTNPTNKLNTALLGIAGDKRPVYVSEHLSPSNKILHMAARKKAREQNYQFVWVRNGRIYVRKNPDSSYILIKNTESLDLLI